MQRVLGHIMVFRGIPSLASLSTYKQALPITELLVGYIVSVMYSRRRTRASKEATIALALDLFSCFSDKSRFGTSYEIRLAERVLSGGPVDNALESQVVDRLETICGSQFVLKMRGILFDAVGRPVADQRSSGLSGPSTVIKSMNTSYWPPSIVASGSRATETAAATVAVAKAAAGSLHLPRPFRDALQLAKNRGEELGEWTDQEEVSFSTAEGQCTLQWTPESSTTLYRVVCTPIQAMILHCIGAAKAAGINSVSTTQLHRLLQLDDQADTATSANILKRALHSMACHPSKSILAKEPKSRIVRAKDRFSMMDAIDFKGSKIELQRPSRAYVSCTS